MIRKIKKLLKQWLLQSKEYKEYKVDFLNFRAELGLVCTLTFTNKPLQR